MNEMAVTADHLIVIGKGRLIAAASTADVIARGTEKSVLVRSPDAARLTELISAAGGHVARGAVGPDEPEPADGELLTVTNMEAPKIGEIAASAAVVLHELTPRLASLEEVFMELTADSLEYNVRADGVSAVDRVHQAGRVSAEKPSLP
jgi:ABC-2 type transport system ATP-binding protein